MAIFADQSREQLRRMYVEAWRKRRAGEILQPLEAQVADVIGLHPEYHDWLERGDEALAEEFTPERGAQNPFLHMGLHLALREQVSTDRPAGIRALHSALAAQRGVHDAEHLMAERLAEALWSAQRNGKAPDEAAYLETLRRLV